MRVKAVDIARELGLSKATVSLALNDKPGVSEKTRLEIMECRERLQHGESGRSVQERNMIIKVVIVIRDLKIVYDSEMDLSTDVFALFDKEAKKRGYSVGVTYVNVLQDNMDTLINECNNKMVAGVILVGTEMRPEDSKVFSRIEKPMVISDNSLDDLNCYNVIADNRGGVLMAMERLFAADKREIVYLANQVDIYNFIQRRKEYREFIYDHNIETQTNKVINIGTTIESVYRNMLDYIDQHKLPEAFLMENYQVSIGVMRALKSKKLAIPEDISLIGVDVLPSYLTLGCELTTIKVPHTERAEMVMMLLWREMEKRDTAKSVVMTKCQLIEGQSVSG